MARTFKHPMAREERGLFEDGPRPAVQTFNGARVPCAENADVDASLMTGRRVVADVIERAGFPPRVAVAVRPDPNG